MNVILKESSIHGLGVFAKETIFKGETQYIYGLVCPEPSSYGFEHSHGWWEPFPPFRYTNHSETPNCNVFTYETGEVMIEALRSIKAGEELTIDYGHDPTIWDEGTEPTESSEGTEPTEGNSFFWPVDDDRWEY